MSELPTEAPPKPPLVLRVGVTGHRLNGLPKEEVAKEALCRTVQEVLTVIKNTVTATGEEPATGYSPDNPILRIISPLAEGADRMVAQKALDLKYELQCPLPFNREEYANDFPTEDSRHEFHALLGEATAILELDGERTAAKQAYEAVGRVVLKQCDVLIAIWDGQEPEGKGGTGQIVSEAMKLNIPTIWIHAREQIPPQILLGEEEEDTPEPEPLDQLPVYIKNMLQLSHTNQTGLRDQYLNEPPPTVGWRLYTWVYNALAPNNTNQETPQTVLLSEKVSKNIPELLTAHYQWADTQANYYGNQYRSSFLLNFLLSGGAVACAVLAYMWVSDGEEILPAIFSFIGLKVETLSTIFSSIGQPQWLKDFKDVAHILEIVFLITEITIISVILRNTSRAKSRKWHEKWTDYRVLAEHLRQMRMLTALGGVIFPRPLVHHKHEETEDHWVDWQFRAVMRASGMASEKLTHEYLGDCHQFLTQGIIEDQQQYHQKNAIRCQKMHNRLHHLGTRMFYGTGVACGLHFLQSILGENLPNFLSDHFWETVVMLGLTLLTAALPAFGAAIAGILSQGEFKRLSDRSKAMEQWLAECAERLEKPGFKPTFSNLVQQAELAAKIMTREQLDWSFLLKRPVSLPS